MTIHNNRFYFPSFSPENDIHPVTKKEGIAAYSPCVGLFLKCFGYAEKIDVEGKVLYVNKKSYASWKSRHAQKQPLQNNTLLHQQKQDKTAHNPPSALIPPPVTTAPKPIEQTPKIPSGSELEETKSKFIQWCVNESQDASQEAYDQACTPLKELSQALPKKEMVLRQHCFDWGFSFYYGELPGEPDFIPLSAEEGRIIFAQKFGPNATCAKRSSTPPAIWWPVKHPQNNRFFSVEGTASFMYSSSFDTTKDYLHFLIQEAASDHQEKAAKALKILKMLHPYYVREVRTHLDEETYQKLRGLIPAFPNDIPKAAVQPPPLSAQEDDELEVERRKLTDWCSKKENEMGGEEYNKAAAKVKAMAQNLPREEMKLHFFQSRVGFQFYCGEIPGRQKLIPLNFSEGSILYRQKNLGKKESAWFPIRDVQNRQLFSPKISGIEYHPSIGIVGDTQRRLESLLESAFKGNQLSFQILEALLPYASYIKQELTKVAKYQDLRNLIPEYPENP